MAEGQDVTDYPEQSMADRIWQAWDCPSASAFNIPYDRHAGEIASRPEPVNPVGIMTDSIGDSLQSGWMYRLMYGA